MAGRAADAALIATTLALFAVAFSDAAADFAYGDWAYGPYVQVVLDNLPILLALGAVVVLFAPVAGRRG